MNSRTTKNFRKAFTELPKRVQQQTREAYLQFKQNPRHPSLRFKKIHSNLPIYSARISRNYRAIGQLDGDTIIWFWVGSHKDYDRLLAQL